MLEAFSRAVPLARARVAAGVSLPATYRKWVATRLSTDFREAAELVERPLALPAPGEALFRMRYVAINASDVLKTHGFYGDTELPFDLGLEGVGECVAVGPYVPSALLGKIMALSDTGTTAGCFGEYRSMSLLKGYAVPVPKAKPEYAALMVTGVSVQVALAECAKIRRGETVLVTAAAGSGGSYAVQLAKLAGCHVIGTCGGPDKAAMLREIGCDRAINYRAEKVAEVLRAEYPRGVDVVFDSVGGELFDTCLDHLAERGRLIVFGYVADYKDGTGNRRLRPAYDRLLAKSAEIRGFAFKHYKTSAALHAYRLMRAVRQGDVVPVLDPMTFSGIASVVDAVERHQAGRNIGKIVVSL
jgi:NADPH-dependent curcumin reductase CurA